MRLEPTPKTTGATEWQSDLAFRLLEAPQCQMGGSRAAYVSTLIVDPGVVAASNNFEPMRGTLE
jgi:hypothetical protein